MYGEDLQSENLVGDCRSVEHAQIQFPQTAGDSNQGAAASESRGGSKDGKLLGFLSLFRD